MPASGPVASGASLIDCLLTCQDRTNHERRPGGQTELTRINGTLAPGTDRCHQPGWAAMHLRWCLLGRLALALLVLFVAFIVLVAINPHGIFGQPRTCGHTMNPAGGPPPGYCIYR